MVSKGETVELSLDERKLVEIIAKVADDFGQSNHRAGFQRPGASRLGFGGELAIAKLANHYPLCLDITDMTDYDIIIEGVRYDVKTSDWRGPDLTLNINPSCMDKPDIDGFILMHTDDEQFFTYKGRISKQRIVAQPFPIHEWPGGTPHYRIGWSELA